MAAIPKLTQPTLESICKIIGDTGDGLSGTEIGNALTQCQIDDPSAGITKWRRLYDALHQRQESDRCANNILKFLLHVMQPVSYLTRKQVFHDRQTRLNEVLSFVGLAISDEGTLRELSAAKTISEAQERARRLRKTLIDRNIHHDVIKFCRAELIEENYFHAVFEATKSVADKIRDKSGLQSDGAELVDKAFSLGQNNTPKLALNTLRTETEQSEQKGFSHLLKGLFGMVRNVTAHEPKIKWVINEDDAIDSLTLASILHRKLDKCVSTGV